MKKTLNNNQITSIHQLIERQVFLNPHSPAISFNDSTFSYQELNEKSNQLAYYLKAQGVCSGSLVGIMVERSLAMIVGICAVLKAGGAYVPIDPGAPEERIHFMMSDAKLSILLTQSHLREKVSNYQTKIFCFDSDGTKLTAYPITNLNDDGNINQLAYVLYTSGSTGTPKGVMVTHANLLHAYAGWEAIYALNNSDRHLQMANFSFDVFSGDLLRALGSGGQLVLCPKEILLEPDKLYHLMLQEKITCAEFVPTVVRKLIEYVESTHQSFNFMRLLICGSDTWSIHEYHKLKKLCGTATRVINSYGLTEATIDSTYFEGDGSSFKENNTVPIGKPFPHTEIYLFDEQRQPVREGTIGEIYIGGAGVAVGYINQPELTQQKFVEHLCNNASAPVRLYKTGDLGCYLPDGNLRFLGRIDNQVKVRGIRIELSEIENTLNTYPTIKESMVALNKNHNMHDHLVAYIVLEPGADFNFEILHQYLRNYLPAYMIPVLFIKVDALSVTLSGKLDRRNLKINSKVLLNKTRTQSQSSIEKQIVTVLQKLFGVNSINVDDCFLDVGVDSLLLTRLALELEKTFLVTIPLAEFSKTLTIVKLAKLIVKAKDLSVMKQHVINNVVEEKVKKIAVIGGGPAAISFLVQFYNEFKKAPCRMRLEILVFEKAGVIGAGLPYSEIENSFILNLPKEVMEPEFGTRGEFSEWIKTITDCPQQTDFPPRYYFGRYLKKLAEEVQLKAQHLDIKINYFIHHEVLNIQQSSSHQFQVQSHHRHYFVDYVILCTGHMPSESYSNLIGNVGYYHNPWSPEIYHNLNSQESIGIIGSRLTAIDIALKLCQQSHQGKIVMVSRSGLLPAVLAKSIPPYTLRYLTIDNLQHAIRLHGRRVLPLTQLLSLFWQEISEAEGKVYTFDALLKWHESLSPLAWLTHEITASEKGVKPWQQVLFALYPLVPRIWSMLSLQDKQLFLKKYYGIFITYMAAFPLDNACKIQNLLNTQRLTVLGGLRHVHYEKNYCMMLMSNGEQLKFNHVINATGTGYNPEMLTLYQNMISAGLLKKHPLGGISIDADTFQTRNQEGNKNNRIFALGELTRGEHLATTDMTRVAAQAKQVAGYLIKQLFEQKASLSVVKRSVANLDAILY